MIHREDRSSVAVLRLDHGKVSALDVDLLSALADQLEEIERSPSCQSVVLTGTGSTFSAGVDLVQFLDGGDAYLQDLLRALTHTFAVLFSFPRPAIAAVNGHAIAGGCVLACACDYRIMGQGPGKIGVPELRVGIPFPALAIEILRFAASTQHLQELVYLGKTYEVDEAYQRGLVDEVAEPATLLDRACEVATRIGSMPPARFQITKRQLRQPSLDRAERNAREWDTEVLRAWKSPEARTAIRAYAEDTLGRRQRR